METSSPLAALRATSAMPMWAGNDFYNSHSQATGHYSTNLFGSSSFNFRDLSSMNRSTKPDCFRSSILRGSSPTASLAADLSQNFHIDMSPQLPTPRRSLFTSNLFDSFNNNDCMDLTLSASPTNKLHECMDFSPLPHKQPRSTSQMQMESPTPTSSHSQLGEILASSPPLTLYSDISRSINGLERKKYIFSRQGLNRGKSCVSHLIPTRKSENPAPLFRFEAGASNLSTSTSISLGECFMDSPPHERRPQSATCNTSSQTPPPPPRLGKAFVSSNSRLSGSPMANCSKRPSNPLVRPRKLFRRSLSMFENREEMISSQRGDCVVSNLHTVMDIDELHQPTLPHFFQEGNPDSIPRITQKTFLQVLDGEFVRSFDEIMIIDCRFEYEFEGGHIDGAVNFNDKELLATHLFAQDISRKMLLIFHCEYSAHRAPIMARHIRKQDRAANIEKYPMLTFPEVYILDGGYNAFYSQNRDRCFPQNYVEMGDKDHTYTCEREMGRLRQNRSKFSRAQTFAFGESSIDDSPTAPPRCRNINRADLNIGLSPISCGRRLVTY